MFNKIKQSIKDFLLFSNLVDEHDGKLSWTTITLIAALSVFLNNVSDPAALGGVLLALLARSHKKHIASKIDKEQNDKINQLQAQINSLSESTKDIHNIKLELQSTKDEVQMVNNKVTLTGKR